MNLTKQTIICKQDKLQHKALTSETSERIKQNKWVSKWYCSMDFLLSAKQSELNSAQLKVKNVNL